MLRLSIYNKNEYGQWNESETIIDYNKYVPEISNIVYFRSGEKFTESLINYINKIFESMRYF